MGRVIEVTELALRDAHQSLLATRMAMEDMVPACEDLDNAGFWSLECWGGATFDACIRFLNEDPWERLRTFRKLLPKSRLQMLLRGQNLLGYRHYEDSVVERFVDKAAENGMDVFRIFDALNDLRNLTDQRARREEDRQACAGNHLLYRQPAAYRRRVRRDGAAAQGDGLRFHLHQGYGGAAEAAARVRPRQRHQGEMRRRYAGASAYVMRPPASRWSR